MNLSPLVNNKDLWADFLQEVDERIAICHRGLEQASDEIQIYRYQGEIMALKKMKQLRDKVNGA